MNRQMKPREFNWKLLIHLAGILFVAAALCINPLKITRAFFSDESVYYTMAYSFAKDGDMEFQQNDLIRVYREFAAGPQGIVLKVNERDGTIVFGKAFLYSLIAAPFVLVFGTNGFLFLHAVLLWLNLLCGYRFAVAFMQPRVAALFSFFYFLANASLVYLFWMTPEYFNMSLICFALFFFTADERLKSDFKLFHSPFNFILAAIFFAMATYSKLTNAALIVPLGIWMLYRKKTVPALITLAIYTGVTALLFGMNFYMTGDLNYQEGKSRAIFYDTFPYSRAGASPFAAFKQKREVSVGLGSYRPPFIVNAFIHNWGYFFFGRSSGLAIYFFPMYFCLIYYLFSKKDSLSTAVFLCGWTGILTYMVGIPWNYFGGSGTIGNRYLMNSFAVMLFCIVQQPSARALTPAFAASFLFTSTFLFTPVFSSFDNAFHQKHSFFQRLPLERTLLADLPFNTTRAATRVAFDDHPTYLLYFTNGETYQKEAFEHRYGFWVKGDRTAEVVMRTFQPATRLKLLLRPARPGMHVSIEAGNNSSRIQLKEPLFYQGEMSLPAALPYDRDGTGQTYLYKIKITAESGSISTLGTAGERYLGVFVRFELPEVQSLQTIPDEQPSE